MWLPRIQRALALSCTAFMVAFGLGCLMGFEIASSKQVLEVRNATLATADGRPATVGLSTTPIELLGSVRRAHDILTNELKLEYGKFYPLLLQKGFINHIFAQTDSSKNRFQRRILKKILTKQLFPAQEVTFSWVSAGDEAAAGCGNEASDTYTSVLQDTLRPLFASLGVKFAATNKGVAGIGSAPELSMCMEDIFGPHIDILSWDFTIMDHQNYDRVVFWTDRQSLHPSVPLLVMFDEADSERWRHVKQDRRIGSALMDMEAYASFQKRRLPDSNIRRPETLPTSLLYLVCGGATEGAVKCDADDSPACFVDGASKCKEHKFRPGMDCEHEQYQTAWIPGWKEHRLRGRLLGAFILHLLVDSLVYLNGVSTDGNLPSAELWKTMLDAFNGEDKQDKFISEVSQKPHGAFGSYAEVWEEFSNPLNKPATCVLLPSRNPTEEESVSNSSDSNGCRKIDFGYRRRSHVINEGQSFNFSIPVSSNESVIVLCFRTCPLDQCGETLTGLDSVKIENNNVDIEVDGVRAVSSRDLDSCHVLLRNDGVVEWPSPQGRQRHHAVTIRLNEPDSSLHLFSAFVL